MKERRPAGCGCPEAREWYVTGVFDSTSPTTCLRPTGACAWSHHNYKHFGARGLTHEHTRHGPAKYLPTLGEEEIQVIEVETTLRPDLRAGAPESGRTRYARDADTVLGWDEGRDANWSYVECSGGAASARSFHGRPVHAASRTIAAVSRGEAL